MIERSKFVYKEGLFLSIRNYIKRKKRLPRDCFEALRYIEIGKSVWVDSKEVNLLKSIKEK